MFVALAYGVIGWLRGRPFGSRPEKFDELGHLLSARAVYHAAFRESPAPAEG